MNKEELYQQIDNFKLELKEKYLKNNIKEVDRDFYYVSNDEAVDKASFIQFLIENDYMKNSYNHILDMTFGSGNLSSHIIFDNDIQYSTLTLNDYNQENTNQDIVKLIDKSKITKFDILEKTVMSTFAVDLVILNPQIGGNYPIGNINNQKKKNESEPDLLKRLYSNIDIFIKTGATILFYGKDKDFIALFGESNYIKYKADSQQLYIVKNDLKDKQCFVKDNDTFSKIDCDGSIENDDIEALDFDDLNLEVNDLGLDDNIQSVEANKNELIKIKFSDIPKGKEGWQENFEYKNILFKGVPGTGKSRAIDTIIEKYLDIKNEKENILRINIHSASSNSDLMQGIGISTNDRGNIKYSEKQGLILDIIKRATLHPKQPFVLILEEIQENSLNELIGDLIYLIEDSKRAKDIVPNENKYETYEDLVDELVDIYNYEYVRVPYLVNDSTKYKKMIMPDNLFIFCTSNYRDDKKVIEDNLLRRFEVIEIYPKNQEEMGKNEKEEYHFKQKEVSDFLESLNKSILKIMSDNHEIHPDRFMIGHAIWQNVNDEKSFYQSFLKLIVEFKDIRELEFEIFKTIVKDVTPRPYTLEHDYNSYYEMIRDIQSKIKYEFIN